MPDFDVMLKANMDEYYRELGAMTALFTDIDSLVTDATVDLLGCNDEAIAARLVASADFTRKIETLEWLIDHHAHKDGVLGSNEVQTVLRLLERAKELSKTRNDHVHGTRTFNRRKGEYVLLNPAVYRQKTSKSKSHPVVRADAKELSPINQELIRLLLQLYSSIAALRIRLESARGLESA